MGRVWRIATRIASIAVRQSADFFGSHLGARFGDAEGRQDLEGEGQIAVIEAGSVFGGQGSQVGVTIVDLLEKEER